jgi:acyl-CoA reductase-like NAD-dependent aldehyde dehydrogenase
MTCRRGLLDLPAHRDGADLFTTDDRLKLLSFTGSPDVGWDLKGAPAEEG